jgi:hypothetical protein
MHNYQALPSVILRVCRQIMPFETLIDVVELLGNDNLENAQKFYNQQ